MDQAHGQTLRRREPYYFEMVVFQVEDTLFNLPKSYFVTSSVFATIFTLPPGKEDVEGTETKPFMLEGIKAAEFESLMKVMFPMPPLADVKLTLQEWISVLKLSTMWEFTDIRGKAIQELSKREIGMGSVEKIECAKSFDVKKWFLEGSVELLKRPETITGEEAGRLGWETAAKLFLLREQYLSAVITQYSQSETISKTCGRCGQSCGGILYRICTAYSAYHPAVQPVILNDRGHHDFTKAVQKEFKAEL